jgi:hypothetical protein
MHFSDSSLSDRICALVAPAAHRVGHVGERLGDEEALGGAGGSLLVAALREEAVLDEVGVGLRVDLQRLLHAVVVGGDKAVTQHSRTAASFRRWASHGWHPRQRLHRAPASDRVRA